MSTQKETAKQCSTLQCTFGNFPRNKYNAFVRYVRLRRHFETLAVQRPLLRFEDEWSYGFPGRATALTDGALQIHKTELADGLTLGEDLTRLPTRIDGLHDVVHHGNSSFAKALLDVRHNTVQHVGYELFLELTKGMTRPEFRWDDAAQTLRCTDPSGAAAKAVFSDGRFVLDSGKEVLATKSGATLYTQVHTGNPLHSVEGWWWEPSSALHGSGPTKTKKKASSSKKKAFSASPQHRVLSEAGDLRREEWVPLDSRLLPPMHAAVANRNAYKRTSALRLDADGDDAEWGVLRQDGQTLHAGECLIYRRRTAVRAGGRRRRGGALVSVDLEEDKDNDDSLNASLVSATPSAAASTTVSRRSAAAGSSDSAGEVCRVYCTTTLKGDTEVWVQKVGEAGVVKVSAQDLRWPQYSYRLLPSEAASSSIGGGGGGHTLLEFKNDRDQWEKCQLVETQDKQVTVSAVDRDYEEMILSVDQVRYSPLWESFSNPAYWFHIQMEPNSYGASSATLWPTLTKPLCLPMS